MALGEFRGSQDDNESLLFANIGVIDLGSGPNSIPDSVVNLRPYVGYSGWGPMQLEAELAANAWFVVEVHPDDILGMKTLIYGLRFSVAKTVLFLGYQITQATLA
ncbi:MAG: hypothetical protein CM15mP49_14430 [Actinomycetota bacterium]|nr:MAG: hypothetical protein CM15mP49_14430 [Actinomycetota bacterium]